MTDDKPRRSAGMLGSPAAPRTTAATPIAPPTRQAMPAASPVSRHPRPAVLMNEVAAPRGTQIGEHRQAFRAFMAANRLRATEWAKAAGVPVGEILAFLTGRSRSLSAAAAERLARAAKVRPEDMFR